MESLNNYNIQGAGSVNNTSSTQENAAKHIDPLPSSAGKPALPDDIATNIRNIGPNSPMAFQKLANFPNDAIVDTNPDLEKLTQENSELTESRNKSPFLHLAMLFSDHRFDKK